MDVARRARDASARTASRAGAPGAAAARYAGRRSPAVGPTPRLRAPASVAREPFASSSSLTPHSCAPVEGVERLASSASCSRSSMRARPRRRRRSCTAAAARSSSRRAARSSTRLVRARDALEPREVVEVAPQRLRAELGERHAAARARRARRASTRSTPAARRGRRHAGRRVDAVRPEQAPRASLAPRRPAAAPASAPARRGGGRRGPTRAAPPRRSASLERRDGLCLGARRSGPRRAAAPSDASSSATGHRSPASPCAEPALEPLEPLAQLAVLALELRRRRSPSPCRGSAATGRPPTS